MTKMTEVLKNTDFRQVQHTIQYLESRAEKQLNIKGDLHPYNPIDKERSTEKWTMDILYVSQQVLLFLKGFSKYQ